MQILLCLTNHPNNLLFLNPLFIRHLPICVVSHRREIVLVTFLRVRLETGVSVW